MLITLLNEIELILCAQFHLFLSYANYFVSYESSVCTLLNVFKYFYV